MKAAGASGACFTPWWKADMLLPLKHRITYGPVPSRRLGRSLGINLSPPGRKLCSFDCQYGQYGFAAPVADVRGASGFPTPTDPGLLHATAEQLHALRELLAARGISAAVFQR